jgi:hypothetical protein
MLFLQDVVLLNKTQRRFKMTFLEIIKENFYFEAFLMLMAPTILHLTNVSVQLCKEPIVGSERNPPT